jgi:ABC-type polysaccharide/polyol phosphate export permease
MNGREHEAAPVAAQQVYQLESPLIRKIVPAKRRIRLRGLPRDLPVVRVLAARDFKVKYKQSLLGPLWLVFQPLALFAGFLVAFRSRGALGHGIPYIDFALSGLMVWSFFQAAMTIGGASLITNYQLVRFTPCPRVAFPVAAIIASLPSLLIPALGAIIAAAISGTLSVRVLLLPLGFAWLFLLTAGIVFTATSLAVRFRDIISVLPFMLSVGLFLSPVGYPLGTLPHLLRGLIELNPLTGVLEACRWMLLGPYPPSVIAVVLSLVTTSIGLTFGWYIFTRLETTIADEI